MKVPLINKNNLPPPSIKDIEHSLRGDGIKHFARSRGEWQGMLIYGFEMRECIPLYRVERVKSGGVKSIQAVDMAFNKTTERVFAQIQEELDNEALDQVCNA